MNWMLFSILLSLSITNSTAENDITVIPLTNVGVIDISSEQQFHVEHRVDGSDVYVECYLHPFTFTEEKVGMLPVEGEGHLRLYKDDEHVATIFSGAFIIQGLEEGEHELKLVVAHNDHTSYGLEKTFKVTIKK